MPLVACGRCPACRRGDAPLCTLRAAVGLRHPWGGFGELALVGAEQVAVLPENVSWEQGALIEPAAVAATGVEVGNVRPGDTVLIAGAGPIGVLAAIAAESAGAADVLLSEPSGVRAANARELGYQ